MHNGQNLKLVLGVLLVLPVALTGCRSDVAGGKPGQDAGGVDRPPDVPRPDAICPADAAGGGECPLNFCNQAKVGLSSNQFPQSGADSLCGGRTCTVGPELATGDGFQLVCVNPMAAALAFGTACSPDPAMGMRCADDSLCITSPDFPADPFCSRMCRNDADCPTNAYCVEHQAPALTDGRHPIIGMCTPKSKIAGTPCLREAMCQPGQGCVLYGARSSLKICHTGGTKSVGTACTAAAECRSGECYDRDFHVSGGQNRAFCSSACQVNSDCGPDQGCVRLVVGNNGTGDDPLDDLVVGYCRTLFVPLAATACTSDAGCVARQDGSDTCDTTHGLCYRKAAVPGSACTRETDCPVGADCSVGPRFEGGYCQTWGCDPAATSGVDACPGTTSTCAQRGGPDEPISACYEGCVAGGACSRASVGYTCESVAPSVPPSVCLVSSGT
jgi:hypothetical protein